MFTFVRLNYSYFMLLKVNSFHLLNLLLKLAFVVLKIVCLLFIQPPCSVLGRMVNEIMDVTHI